MKNILTPLQTKFLKIFFESRYGHDFFLSGGTALAAFYLQHRLSEDLDLFTLDQKIEFNEVNAEIMRIIFHLQGKIKQQVSTTTFLRFIFQTPKETLKVDLVKDTPMHFGKVRKINGFQIDSPENIGVGKLLALFGRADAKDFIDLYFLLHIKRKFDFNKLFNLSKKKDLGLSEFYLAAMITKITEIKFLPKMLIPIEKEAMKKFFLELADSLYQKIKPPMESI